MSITKFTWADSDVSLYNQDTNEQFKIREGSITQILRSATNRHINGGYRYKRIKTKSGIKRVQELLAQAVETNPANKS